VTYKTFGIGVAVCLALMIAIGFGINAINRGHSRPEGVAEDWLAAVGDATREGVEADATRRAEEIAPILTEEVLAGGYGLIGRDTDGKSAFADLEVGKAVRAQSEDGTDGRATVRFRVHARRADDLVELDGEMLLRDAKQGWVVEALEVTRRGGTATPSDGFAPPPPPLASDGGPPPSSASAGVWVGGVLVGVLVTVVASALVNWAGREPALAVAR